jgi:hypothetical protein
VTTKASMEYAYLGEYCLLSQLLHDLRQAALHMQRQYPGITTVLGPVPWYSRNSRLILPTYTQLSSAIHPGITTTGERTYVSRPVSRALKQGTGLLASAVLLHSLPRRLVRMYSMQL